MGACGLETSTLLFATPSAFGGPLLGSAHGVQDSARGPRLLWRGGWPRYGSKGQTSLGSQGNQRSGSSFRPVGRDADLPMEVLEPCLIFDQVTFRAMGFPGPSMPCQADSGCHSGLRQTARSRLGWCSGANLFAAAGSRGCAALGVLPLFLLGLESPQLCRRLRAWKVLWPENALL